MRSLKALLIAHVNNPVNQNSHDKKIATQLNYYHAHNKRYNQAHTYSLVTYIVKYSAPSTKK